jgi:hypothetical protein
MDFEHPCIPRWLAYFLQALVPLDKRIFMLNFIDIISEGRKDRHNSWQFRLPLR